jgi:tetratricopeptide (TPR) repeat protein
MPRRSCENGDLRAAYGAALKALELEPGSVHALKLKGTMDLRSGGYRQALESFRRAVDSDAGDPEALQWLGTAHQVLFQYAEAATVFGRGIARFRKILSDLREPANELSITICERQTGDRVGAAPGALDWKRMP